MFLLTSVARRRERTTGTLERLLATSLGRDDLLAGYAQRADQPSGIQPGVGLVGQAAAEKQRILLNDVPPEYTQVQSSLGQAPPKSILILPVLFTGPGRKPGQLSGRSPYLQPVHVSAPLALIGSEIPVRIARGHPNSLLGTLEPEKLLA